MAFNMGIRSDLIFVGLAIGAVILFRNQLGSALASAGTSLGGGISGGLKAFADSITGAFNIGGPVTTQIPGLGTITGPSEAVVTQTAQGTQVITVPGAQFVQEVIPPGATPTNPPIPGADGFFDPLFDFFDSLLNPLPGTAGELSPPIVTSQPSPTGTAFSVDIIESGLAGTSLGMPIITGTQRFPEGSFGDLLSRQQVTQEAAIPFMLTRESSLSSIIDEFGVSASQAANIRFTQEPPNGGLTPEQIALQLIAGTG